ncbi:hypothetical protein B0T26DRAFT_700441 [Lasiosphaeria miniovina]|uniref:Uncharacterized protein n=1 Tax=Lasiosphaeria miniovina TaxID=1954250 RepID=A0AA40ATQ3_9PEZI|nr:uncharacterized protein B0T26DRAFT_700441 [Lasiosphaeria miniovina]KAK0721847.1 hypothetical protein B0T26DRAFT_700441 [Lasiosphaeria miniovina]
MNSPTSWRLSTLSGPALCPSPCERATQPQSSDASLLMHSTDLWFWCVRPPRREIQSCIKLCPSARTLCPFPPLIRSRGEFSLQCQVGFTEPMAKFPPTYDQIEGALKAFIDSIDPDAVCSLASLHNSSKNCRMFRDAASGSYNVCYFVEFDDGTQWVVRIPLEPCISNVWDKVQSEVATIR